VFVRRCNILKNEFSLTHTLLPAAICTTCYNILAVLKRPFCLVCAGVLIYFVIIVLYLWRKCNIGKRTQSDTAQYLHLICFYLHNPSLIFKETFLLPWCKLGLFYLCDSNRVFGGRELNLWKEFTATACVSNWGSRPIGYVSLDIT